MPDYLFEVSWEVCNKVGGIHTVLATKALHLAGELKKHHIHIGPDVWRNTERNPEFTEDPALFKSWRRAAENEGLRVRVGHWNVPGSPIAFLVDYTHLIARKNDILTGLWSRFGVDSISGDWDYVESALFGYAAGEVIQSFAKFRIATGRKVVAQFHEWMTGAGLLYLKASDMPVGTVFTTHATVLGRCVSSNGLPLYDGIEEMEPDKLAVKYGVVARHSLEKAAAQQADVFTTVSDLTAIECKQFLGRQVDIVTPNGFEDTIAPAPEEMPAARAAARSKLLEVAHLMSGKDYDDSTMLLCTSGRYEYTNKGMDVVMDALGKLSKICIKGRQVAAFIMVPSGNHGPDKGLLEKMQNPSLDYRTAVSHYLMDDYDIISRRMRELELDNGKDTCVDVFFIPSYLNGNDGIFNMTYYDLLAGMDLSIFPSYYEPWGYTPLESLAFMVPTVTTTTAGFGLWVNDHYPADKPKNGICIVKRTDSNYDEVVDSVCERIFEIAKLNAKESAAYRGNAREISKIALWQNNISYYKEAYALAIDKVEAKYGKNPVFREDTDNSYTKMTTNTPSWTRMIITRQLPERLRPLEELAKNLWWCWNQEASELFESIDSKLWKDSKGNPLEMLDRIKLSKYKELLKDTAFLSRLDGVYADFSAYMKEKDSRPGPSIAYFCMEYGIDTSLKIYSGGLGILAGDYLKEASDMKVNMTAVGLLYKYGYFTQKLSAQGDQVSTYEPQDFSKAPVTPIRDKDGQWLTVSIAFPGRTMYARLWKAEVGRTDLILLDTDFEDNHDEDRHVTHQLYGGDWENRLKQEILLGMGGVRALRLLGLNPEVYHCNEGHAAFMGIERMREYVNDSNLTYLEALEMVRSSSLFTTHTPVPAGHDAFTEDMLRVYMSQVSDYLKADWGAFMQLGKIHPEDPGEKFSMSVLAANLSQEVNGVSWLHGKVSQKILSNMWPGYLPEELHVSYVTNGVHYPTWTAPEWKKIHAGVFGPQFQTHHYDKSCFNGIHRISDDQIWKTRNLLRKRLIDAVKNILSDTSATAHYSPQQIVKIKDTLRDDILTIGFARRFATYKRATLLFRNLDRLSQIINNPKRPVQFLFAGKAHPADRAGQDLIKRIIEISKMPQFIGKVVFIPNYDITIAKLLVQGVDVWMNNPTRPQEASGTSGEKAVMNGVMHFSVLDGWWVEGYKPGAGWALPMERTYTNQDFQDELDSATIYNILDTEIARSFYDKDSNGMSYNWIATIKNTISEVACNFTTNRMMEDYLRQFYVPLAKRTAELGADDFQEAREIALWKKDMRREWNNIEIISNSKNEAIANPMVLGQERISEIVVNLGDVAPEDIGFEMVIAEQDMIGEYHVREIHPYHLASYKDGIATFNANITPEITGSCDIAARMYAKNDKMPHRQDFELVKWL
ncbi:MAG: alpha-glucan family phosphorylase [Bacteroidales bacterium]|nr:alpha-glucan family phosphorylase [Bacteroidales bacterium]MBO7479960.1 alpha-glucan family phosphorylase [Bacteroidales bacterium]